MKEFEVCVAGHVVFTTDDREKAEQELDNVRHSWYALVHPYDCMYIIEKKEKRG